MPPPTSATSETVWCGARKGRLETRPVPGDTSPATEWMAVTSSASSNVSGGRTPPSRLAIIVFPAPGGPMSSALWPPAAAISSARRAEELAVHVREIRRRFSRRRRRRGALRSRHEPGRIVHRMHRLAKGRHPIQPQARNDGRFGLVAQGQQESAVAVAARARGHRQYAASRLYRAVERQRANQQQVVDVAPGDAPGRGQHAERNRQIEVRPFLADVSRGEVDGDAVRREFVARIANRAADAVAALADARIGESDHGERRQPERDVDLHLHRKGLDAEDAAVRTQASMAGHNASDRAA